MYLTTEIAAPASTAYCRGMTRTRPKVTIMTAADILSARHTSRAARGCSALVAATMRMPAVTASGTCWTSGAAARITTIDEHRGEHRRPARARPGADVERGGLHRPAHHPAAEEAGDDVGDPLADEVAAGVAVRAVGVGDGAADPGALHEPDDDQRERRQRERRHQGEVGQMGPRQRARDGRDVADDGDRGQVDERDGDGHGHERERHGEELEARPAQHDDQHHGRDADGHGRHVRARWGA